MTLVRKYRNGNNTLFEVILQEKKMVYVLCRQWLCRFSIFLFICLGEKQIWDNLNSVM